MVFGLKQSRVGKIKKIKKSLLEAQNHTINEYRRALDKIHRHEKHRKEHPPPPEVVEGLAAVVQHGIRVPPDPAPWSKTLISLIEYSSQRVQRLHAMFPAVFLPTTISNIMRHTFAPMDLVTLNPRRKGEKFVKAGTLRDYPTLHSLLVPLATYFSVLQAACAAMGNEQATRLIGEGGLRYTAHLVELEEAFQWPAVVQYHMQLHEKRRHDMMNGDYSQWAFGDKELKNRLLVGRDRGQRGGMQSSASAKSCPKKF